MLFGAGAVPAAANDIYEESPDDRAMRERIEARGGKRRECSLMIELAVRQLAPDGLHTGWVPVERTAWITQYGDGSGRIAVMGPAGICDDLTPDVPFVEAEIAAEAFAPLAFALFDSVDVDGSLFRGSELARDWRDRRRLRIW
jgi:hypothetical protein